MLFIRPGFVPLFSSCNACPEGWKNSDGVCTSFLVAKMGRFRAVGSLKMILCSASACILFICSSSADRSRRGGRGKWSEGFGMFEDPANDVEGARHKGDGFVPASCVQCVLVFVLSCFLCALEKFGKRDSIKMLRCGAHSVLRKSEGGQGVL